MSHSDDQGRVLPEDDWTQVWQTATGGAPDVERQTSLLLAQIARFDRKVFLRNVREYAAGLVLMVIFAAQTLVGRGGRTGVIGLLSVGFVMVYLWWNHRQLTPLDPAADLATYRTALLKRYDDQIRLLRTAPYWYLIPLSLPALSIAASVWPRSRAMASALVVIVTVVYILIGWLNRHVAVGMLRSARQAVAAAFPQD